MGPVGSSHIEVTGHRSDLGSWRAVQRPADRRLRDYVLGYFASESFLPRPLHERHLPSREVAIVLNFGAPHRIMDSSDPKRTTEHRSALIVALQHRHQIPPKSRTEFILAVHDRYLKLKASDPKSAQLINIRHTGLQAYSIMEGYECVKAGMRLYRAAGTTEAVRINVAAAYAPISPVFSDPAQIRQMLASDIAFYMGWLGHYVADAAEPLHNSQHHDGWAGANPKGYTRDPEITAVLKAATST